MFDARLYQPAPASEMADARISALETRLRDKAGDQAFTEHSHALDALYARVHSLEIYRSWPKLDPAPGIASRCLATASRLARRLPRLIFDARSTLGGFLAGVMFAIFCTFWFYDPRLHPASASIGALNMLHGGHGRMPNLREHGAILRAAADTRGSSLFDGGATHIVHEDDKGAIHGSWQPDVAGLRLGDDTFIQAFGSVLKDFIPPPDVGGPDIRRRVLIAPAVACRVWSGTQEVDMYGSEHESAL